MSETLNSAAYAAGLSPADKRKVDELSKALKVGTETPEEKPRQGWLGTANHYTGYQAFKALNFLADKVSQTYRAAVIPIIQRGEIGFAWDEAGKDGEKVYNTGRLDKAKIKYGDAQIRMAQKN
jgi:hypothetical protein